MFKRILIANRGEIALRVIRTAREMGIETVAVYSDVDRKALHTRFAHERGAPGRGSLPSESYLDMARRSSRAARRDRRPGHPPRLRLPVGERGLRAPPSPMPAWPGSARLPRPSRRWATRSPAEGTCRRPEVPVVPGLDRPGRGRRRGGAAGGREGDRLPDRAQGRRRRGAARASAWCATRARWRARSAPPPARRSGQPSATGACTWSATWTSRGTSRSRSCSTAQGQRRALLRARVLDPEASSEADRGVPLDRGDDRGHACASMGARSPLQAGARHRLPATPGTVEFLYSNGEFYFLEMNTRLQVEHPRDGDGLRASTSCASSSRVARGRAPRLRGRSRSSKHGWSIEVRINAEDPFNGFVPSTGTIRNLRAARRPPGCASTARLVSRDGGRADLRPDARQADRLGSPTATRPSRAWCARCSELNVGGVRTGAPAALAGPRARALPQRRLRYALPRGPRPLSRRARKKTSSSPPSAAIHRHLLARRRALSTDVRLEPSRLDRAQPPP